MTSAILAFVNAIEKNDNFGRTFQYKRNAARMVGFRNGDTRMRR